MNIRAWGSGTAAGAMLAGLVLAPLPYGSVLPWARSFLEIFSFLALGLVLAGGRRRGAFDGKRLTPLAWGMAFLVAGGLIQILPLPPGLLRLLSPGSAAVWAGKTPSGWAPISVAPGLTADNLLLLAAGCALFWAAALFRPAPGARPGNFPSLLIGAILTVGFVISVAGIARHFSAPREIYGIREITRGAPFGPFVNRNHFAGYIEMIIPCGLILLFAPPSSRPQAFLRRLFRKSPSRDPRPILIAFMVTVMTWALLLSGSRGGIVSLAAATGFLAACARRAGLLTSKNCSRIIIILLAGAVAFGVWFGWRRVGHRFQGIEGTPLRVRVWSDSLEAAGSFPLFGSGLGTFAEVFPSYQSFPFNYRFTHAENDYVQMALEMGAWGTGGALWLLFFWYRAVFAGIRPGGGGPVLSTRRGFSISPLGVLLGTSAGVTALLVHELFNFNLHVPSNFILFCALAGLAAGAAGETSHE